MSAINVIDGFVNVQPHTEDMDSHEYLQGEAKKEAIRAQQRYAIEHLEEVRKWFPEAVIAGGAARDWYMGRLCRDVDIIIPGISDPILMSTVLKNSFKEYSPVGRDYYEMKGILSVVSKPKGSSHFQPEIQLVFWSNPYIHSIIGGFPSPLSKAFVVCNTNPTAPTAYISVDSEFILAYKHKVHWQSNEMNGHKQDYIKKICDKFPDYKFFPTKELALEHVVGVSGGLLAIHPFGDESK